MLSSHMTKTFRDNCDINIVQQTSCEPFSRCSNTVENVVCTFSFLLYVHVCITTIWCNFRKESMQRLRVAYNFGCRALYNLPWKASVRSHQVHWNIPTFCAPVRKNKYLFLETCTKSNNVWLRALMQSDCLYSSLFFEHDNRVSLFAWVFGHCSVCSFEDVTTHSYFTWPRTV